MLKALIYSLIVLVIGLVISDIVWSFSALEKPPVYGIDTLAGLAQSIKFLSIFVAGSTYEKFRTDKQET